MSAAFKQTEDAFGQIIDWSVKRIDEAKERILTKADKPDNLEEVSMLEKLILKHGPDSPIAFVMAFDMLIAGIDTTGNTSAFMLYNLAT